MKMRSTVVLFVSLLALAGPMRAATPALGAWDARPADAEAAPGYSDRAWTAADAPLPAAADSGLGAYTWYRAVVSAPAAGSYQMQIQSAPGRVRLYVNGSLAWGPDRPKRMVDLKKGRNQITVLAVNDGVEGAPDARGAFGPVTLSATPARRVAVPEWRWTVAPSAEAAARLAADPAGSGWAGWPVSRSGQGTLGGGRYGVYAAALPDLPGGGREVWFESVDDNATVYLNGRRVGVHNGWDEPFGVPLDEGWRADAPNTLMVVVENTNGQGGITGPVEARAFAGASEARPVAGWKVRAGLSPLDPSARWHPFQHVTGRPTYYRTHFTLPAGGAATPALRFDTGPLERGFVWLNGQSLGRYPDRGSPGGLPLPEGSLRPGRNILVVFDENGRMPTGARLVADRTVNR